MDNVVNLMSVKVLMESAQIIEQIHEDTEDALDKLLFADVSKFDGRMLRKSRDHILQFRRIMVESSPEGRKLVEARIRSLSLDRPLTEDETLDALAPELARVSVSFA